MNIKIENKKMIIIQNTKLFEKIKNATNKWAALFKDEFGTLEDASIPFFAGQLDHISETKNQVVFHDRGSGGRDNTFVIRAAKQKIKIENPNLEKISKIVTSETIGFYLLTKTAQKKLDADLQIINKKYVIFYHVGNTFVFDEANDIENDAWTTIAYHEKIEEMITDDDAAFLLRHGRKVRDFL